MSFLAIPNQLFLLFQLSDEAKRPLPVDPRFLFLDSKEAAPDRDSLLFGVWSRLIFSDAALDESFLTHNILAAL
jgi:hypothetical protein